MADKPIDREKLSAWLVKNIERAARCEEYHKTSGDDDELIHKGQGEAYKTLTVDLNRGDLDLDAPAASPGDLRDIAPMPSQLRIENMQLREQVQFLTEQLSKVDIMRPIQISVDKSQVVYLKQPTTTDPAVERVRETWERVKKGCVTAYGPSWTPIAEMEQAIAALAGRDAAVRRAKEIFGELAKWLDERFQHNSRFPWPTFEMLREEMAKLDGRDSARLVWTKAAPTRPGDYRVKYPAGFQRIHEVKLLNGKLMFIHLTGQPVPMRQNWDGYEFWRIPEPEDQ